MPFAFGKLRSQTSAVRRSRSFRTSQAQLVDAIAAHASDLRARIHKNFENGENSENGESHFFSGIPPSRLTLLMHNLFEPSRATELRERLARLQPDSRAHWGAMTVSQAMAHCAAAFDNALGDKKPKRLLIGRIIGPLVKRLAIGDDKPIKRNSPTSPELVMKDERNFDSERRRLDALIVRFAAEGAPGCTRHPHSFFGRMTPDEWAVLMYKHTDHHLRQFGV